MFERSPVEKNLSSSFLRNDITKKTKIKTLSIDNVSSKFEDIK